MILLELPEGFRDLLFDEFLKKKYVEDVIRRCFKSWGYNEIKTPLLEFLELFLKKSGVSENNIFKILDKNGKILALRYDITMQIARIVSCNYENLVFPLRVFYVDEVFRYDESQVGKPREITQAGVELIGSSTVEEDAEIIALAITILKEMGISEFKIEIGHVDFLNGLLEQHGLNGLNEIRNLIYRKNFSELENYLSKLNVDEPTKNVFLKIPDLYGDIEIIDKCHEFINNPKSLKALERLENIYRILEGWRMHSFITFDLGIIQNLNYYTGIVFKGLCKHIGYYLLSGGRYNSLLEEFRLKEGAVGFAFDVDALTNIVEINESIEREKEKTLIWVNKRERREDDIFDLAEELRRAGEKVIIYWDKILDKRFVEKNKIVKILEV